MSEIVTVAGPGMRDVRSHAVLMTATPGVGPLTGEIVVDPESVIVAVYDRGTTVFELVKNCMGKAEEHSGAAVAESPVTIDTCACATAASRQNDRRHNIRFIMIFIIVAGWFRRLVSVLEQSRLAGTALSPPFPGHSVSHLAHKNRIQPHPALATPGFDRPYKPNKEL